MKLVYTISTLLLPVWLFAQDDSLIARIPIVCRVTTDSVSLRWAPPDQSTWKAGNNFGYRLEKYLIVRKGVVVDPPERLSYLTDIKPISLEHWEAVAKKYPNAVVIAQALYGKTFDIDLGKSDAAQIVNQSNANQQRFGMALLMADVEYPLALASGLAWTDQEINSDEKYLYRISIANAAGVSLAEGSVFVDANDTTTLPTPVVEKATVNEGMVTVIIDPAKYKLLYTSFNLEKSNDSLHFSPVSPLPHFQIDQGNSASKVLLSDTLKNDAYYRIVATSLFGETGPPSRIFKLKNVVSLSAMPYITEVVPQAEGYLKIHWEFPEDFNDQVNTFHLERAESNKGPYVVLKDTIKVRSRATSDTAPEKSNYYRIVAVGKNGAKNTSQSFFAQMIDSIAPLPPTGLRGQIDTAGLVTLQWDKGFENDIYGYRLYKAHYKNQEPSLVSEELIRNTDFIDHENVNTLNRKVYYYIMSLDKSQNHSPLSMPLQLTLPDRIKPQPPISLMIQNIPEGLDLYWKPSSSYDVAHYSIYRKEINSGKWYLIKSLDAVPDTIYMWSDLSAIPGKKYYYTVLAIDSSSLESMPAKPVYGQRTAELKPPVLLQPPIVDRSAMTIQLNWKSKEVGVKAYHIYRKSALSHDQFTLYQKLPGNIAFWVDRKVMPGESYEYFILASYEDSSFSGISETHTVDF